MKPYEIKIQVDPLTGRCVVNRPVEKPALEIALILSQVVVQVTAAAMSESGNKPLVIPHGNLALHS